MEQTLVLNASYEPLRIVSWQKAITMLFQIYRAVQALRGRKVLQEQFEEADGTH